MIVQRKTRCRISSVLMDAMRDVGYRREVEFSSWELTFEDNEGLIPHVSVVDGHLDCGLPYNLRLLKKEVLRRVLIDAIEHALDGKPGVSRESVVTVICHPGVLSANRAMRPYYNDVRFFLRTDEVRKLCKELLPQLDERGLHISILKHGRHLPEGKIALSIPNSRVIYMEEMLTRQGLPEKTKRYILYRELCYMCAYDLCTDTFDVKKYVRLLDRWPDRWSSEEDVLRATGWGGTMDMYAGCRR